MRRSKIDSMAGLEAVGRFEAEEPLEELFWVCMEQRICTVRATRVVEAAFEYWIQ